MPFPNLDPIPLPAPVWFFKALHIVTLSLHFTAVHILIGGLVLATIWNFLGRRDSSSTFAASSSALAHRLPIVMTYLINLGIPPLLFAQVLYGRALYTSSVLIGAYWIAVIFLLMAGYYLLYAVARRDEAGRPWWWLSLLSLALIAYIGRIYSTNMTLMIRPEVWLEMYRTAGGAHGATMPTGDPTVLPRWLFMMIGSIGFGGIFAALLGARSSLSAPMKQTMRRWGGGLGAASMLAQLALGFWVWNAQPPIVRESMLNAPLYRHSLIVWLAVSGLFAIGSGATMLTAVSRSSFWPAATSAMGILSIAAAVTARDGIRDMTLLAKGFDVWAQPVVSNWSVVILFLILFAAGLAVIGWMMTVAAQAKGTVENHV
ncbi:MAG: hypothetical protein SF339_25135 [Blastocatellia bacterium]|nr:hypothetical protein [Blastocatellia bacterium]